MHAGLEEIAELPLSRKKCCLCFQVILVLSIGVKLDDLPYIFQKCSNRKLHIGFHQPGKFVEIGFFLCVLILMKIFAVIWIMVQPGAILKFLLNLVDMTHRFQRFAYLCTYYLTYIHWNLLALWVNFAFRQIPMKLLPHIVQIWHNLSQNLLFRRQGGWLQATHRKTEKRRYILVQEPSNLAIDNGYYSKITLKFIQNPQQLSQQTNIFIHHLMNCRTLLNRKQIDHILCKVNYE